MLENLFSMNSIIYVAADSNGTSMGWELNLVTTVASKPAARHSLSFIITVVIMTVRGGGLFVGLVAERCG